MKPAVLFALLLLGVRALAESSNVVLYVAPMGSDAAAGTREAPFASLERARDELRLRRRSGTLSGGATVELLPGTYSRAQPFELTAEDSGDSPEQPILYASATGKVVRLTGGTVVQNFRPVSDAKVLARLDASVRGRVLQADLKALGITDYGLPTGGGPELFCNAQAMPLARWPNEGFVKIVAVLPAAPSADSNQADSTRSRFTYEGDRAQRWLGEKDLWLHGYWYHDWSDSRQRVAKIDTQQRVIELAPPQHGYGYRAGQWYYAFNALSEIDAPGEWVLDREVGRLYFLPPAPLQPDSVVVSVAQSLIRMQQVSNVTLRGLTLEACRGTAMSIDHARYVEIVGCTIRNTGLNAIDLAGSRSGVIGCDIYQVGKTGISLTGGDRRTLTGAGLYADNNHLYEVGRIHRMYSGAINLAGVGNRATHNLIDNCPHTAIFFSGNDHVMESNEIHSVCYEARDAGAIYAGRDWTQRGSIIRYNYLHDLKGLDGQGCMGVYLDDMFCGTTVQGNLFDDVTSMAVLIGGGRDNVIDNNLFVDCIPCTIHMDDRAMSWGGKHTDLWIEEAKTRGTISGMAYNKPPYSTRFPALAAMLAEEPAAPRGNRITRNVFADGEWQIKKTLLPHVTIENNLTAEDPHFVDPANRNYQLRPTSPAFALGFQPLPSPAGIGLYPDDRRASWPVMTKVRATEK